MYGTTPHVDISTKELRQYMSVNFEANFFAYKATVPYLLEQNKPNSTFTVVSGPQGDVGAYAAPAMTQGALFSMCNAAFWTLKNSSIRFDGNYLALRVEVDDDAEKNGTTKSSDFAKMYDQILARPEICNGRVLVKTP